MSDEYTPDTDCVRGFYVGQRFQLATYAGEYAPGIVERYAEFDRWLAAHDAKVRADQIENDAAIAEREDWRDARLFGDEGAPHSNGAKQWSRYSAAAIRAQLNGENDG